MSLPNFINFEPFNRLRHKMHVEKLGNFQLAKKATRAVVNDPSLLVKEPVRVARKAKAQAIESATELKQAGRRRIKAASAAVKFKASDGAVQCKGESQRRVRAADAAVKAVAKTVKPAKAAPAARPRPTNAATKAVAKSATSSKTVRTAAEKSSAKSPGKITAAKSGKARGAATRVVRAEAVVKSKTGKGRA